MGEVVLGIQENQPTIDEDLKTAFDTGVVSKRLSAYLLAQHFTFLNSVRSTFPAMLMETLEVTNEDILEHVDAQIFAILPPVDSFRCLCNAIMYVYKKKSESEKNNR